MTAKTLSLVGRELREFCTNILLSQTQKIMYHTISFQVQTMGYIYIVLPLELLIKSIGSMLTFNGASHILPLWLLPTSVV